MHNRLPSITSRLALGALFSVLALSAGATPGPTSRTVDVDCAAGDTIAHALARPADELIVHVAGVCVEDVVVERDRVTLRGITPDATIQGDPASPGAAVLIRGVSRVDLQDLVVTGGEAIGVQLLRNAEARLRRVRIVEVPQIGLALSENSSVLLNDTVISDHGLFGALIFGHSGLTVQGSNEFSRNGQIGLLMSSGSNSHTRGVGRVTANDNGVAGIFLQASAGGLFPVVEARRNGFSGIDLTFGGEFTGVGGGPVTGVGDSDFSENGVYGVVVGDRGRFFGQGRFVDNGLAGIFAEEGSHVNVATDVPSTITGSTVDVILEGAVGTFGGTTQDEGTVTIGTMDLSFGSRASFGSDVTLGTLVCDATVLTQGSVSCPGSLESARGTLDGNQGFSIQRRELPRSVQPILP